MTTQIHRAYVIINPASGYAAPPIKVIQDNLRKYDIKPVFRLTNSEGDISRFAQEAIDNAADTVVVYGGDGTVMKAASVLRDSNLPLAILPGGTQNIIASALNLYDDLAKGIALTFGGRSHLRRIDLGYVNDQPFLIRVGIGWEAHISTDNTSEMKRRWHQLSYQMATFRALIDVEVKPYRITIDGHTREVEAINCSVCNIGNIGRRGIKFAPGIQPDDGILDVVIVPDKSIKSLADFWRTAMASARSEPSNEALPHWRGKSIHIEIDPNEAVTHDGQTFEYESEPGSLRIEVIPGALQIITPSVPQDTEEVS